MKALLVFLVLFPAFLAVYFIWLREPFKAQVLKYLPQFAGLFEADERFFEWAFHGSRTLVLSRGTAFLGYAFTLLDLVLPFVDQLVGAGVDVDGITGVKGLGPMLALFGHVLTYIRKDTKDPLED